MIADLEREALPESVEAAVCIVGAGAVGLCLAVTLAQRGVDVLLLEGGGAQLETASQDMQRGASVGHPFESVGVGRYRVLGGSTTYWGGQVLPFDDFVVGPRPWA
ncbi:MAG: FAD-dependent oxidoreductase, partial [Rubrivivax sp.]